MRWSPWSAQKLWIAAGFGALTVSFVAAGLMRGDSGFYWGALLWAVGAWAYAWEGLSERFAEQIQGPSASLTSDAGRLVCTLDGEEAWTFDLDELRQVLECTTDGGPWSEDWFLVFVAGNPAAHHEVPVGALADPVGWIVENLGSAEAESAELSAQPQLALFGSTENAVRVLWAAEGEPADRVIPAG